MTNLDIIKYLSTNNPTRLAELLDDIYCTAWNCGSYAGSNGEGKLLEECEIDDFDEWIHEDASKRGFYYDEELDKWSKTIKNPLIEIVYPDNLVIELPWEGKDPNHMWNTDNGFNIVSKALEELELLETLNRVVTIPDVVYDNFRKNVCSSCSDQNCLRSQVEICDCYKFEV